MRHAIKKIVRSNYHNASKAADEHIAKMEAKGWVLSGYFDTKASGKYVHVIEMTK